MLESHYAPRTRLIIIENSTEIPEDSRTGLISLSGPIPTKIAAAEILSPTGNLVDVDEAEWRHSLEVNLTSQFTLTKRVWSILENQGIGASLVYISSKNAFAPGAGFGPYSVAKAGLVQLAKIAALEGGKHGIRANVVNPDAIFSGSRLWSDEIRRERADAHELDMLDGPEPPEQIVEPLVR